MKKQTKPRAKPLTRKASRRLDTIYNLMDDGLMEEARHQLWAFTRAHPNVVDGWLALVELSTHTQESFLSWYGSRRLMALDPHEEIHSYNVAVSSVYLKYALLDLIPYQLLSVALA